MIAQRYDIFCIFVTYADNQIVTVFRSFDLLFFTTIRQCKNTKITELKVNQIQFIEGKNAVHAGFR